MIEIPPFDGDLESVRTSDWVMTFAEILFDTQGLATPWTDLSIEARIPWVAAAQAAQRAVLARTSYAVRVEIGQFALLLYAAAGDIDSVVANRVMQLAKPSDFVTVNALDELIKLAQSPQ